jgi:hypothetical protein
MRSGLRASPLLLALIATACGEGRTIVLGYREPPPYHFDVPRPVTELMADARSDNPTLTADLLEIVFTSDRVSGNGDIWTARRAHPSLPFDPPVAVDELNQDTFETSAAISADGLTLWFGSDRPGGVGDTDIWVSGRASRAAAWSTPVNVVGLNTAAEDIPRPPGQHGLVMPLASTLASPLTYQTYLSARPSPGAPFGDPALIAELAKDFDYSIVDAFLTDDGLTLFYSSARAPALGDAAQTAPPDGGVVLTSDLYVAWRLSTSEKFSGTQPLGDLNTAGDERDPWLTPDGRTLYFTSDRDGVLGIYTAAVKPR